MPAHTATKKDRFVQSWDNFFSQHGKTPDKYVQTSTVPKYDETVETIMFLAVLKHKGADINAKFNYVLTAYDDDLRHKHNPEIAILYWEFTAIED